MRGKGEEAPQLFYVRPLARYGFNLIMLAIMALAVSMMVFGPLGAGEAGVWVAIALCAGLGMTIPFLFPYRLYSDRIEKRELFRKTSIPLSGAVIRSSTGSDGAAFCGVVFGDKTLWIRESDPCLAPLCALLRERLPVEANAAERSGIFRDTPFNRVFLLGLLVFLGLMFASFSWALAVDLVRGDMGGEENGTLIFLLFLGLWASVGVATALLLRAVLHTFTVIEIGGSELIVRRPGRRRSLPLAPDTRLSWGRSYLGSWLAIRNGREELRIPAGLALFAEIYEVLSARYPVEQRDDLRQAPIRLQSVWWGRAFFWGGAAFSLCFAGWVVYLMAGEFPIPSVMAMAFPLLLVFGAIVALDLVPRYVLIDDDGIRIVRWFRTTHIPRAAIAAVTCGGSSVFVQTMGGKKHELSDVMFSVPAQALHRAVRDLYFGDAE